MAGLRVESISAPVLLRARHQGWWDFHRRLIFVFIAICKFGSLDEFLIELFIVMSQFMRTFQVIIKHAVCFINRPQLFCTLRVQGHGAITWTYETLMRIHDLGRAKPASVLLGLSSLAHRLRSLIPPLRSSGLWSPVTVSST